MAYANTLQIGLLVSIIALKKIKISTFFILIPPKIGFLLQLFTEEMVGFTLQELVNFVAGPAVLVGTAEGRWGHDGVCQHKPLSPGRLPESSVR